MLLYEKMLQNMISSKCLGVRAHDKSKYLKIIEDCLYKIDMRIK